MIDDAIRSIIASHADLNRLLAGRVRPLAMAQTDKRPCVVYNVGTESRPTLQGVSSLRFADVELAIYADTYDAVTTISDHLRELFDGTAHTAGGVRIAPSKLSNETDVESTPAAGKEKPVYVRVQTFRMAVRIIDS